ncbi:MAG: hypothetical protein ACP5MB_11075, partial [bacterium]
MKSTKISKGLLFVGLASVMLASCGGGGGGGGGSTTPGGGSGGTASGGGTTSGGSTPSGGGSTTPTGGGTGQTTPTCPSGQIWNGTQCIAQLSNPFGTSIYDTRWNTPYVVVYINNQPVKLILDTGASGIMVEQAAVKVPSSAYTSYTFSGQFGDGSSYSGTIASATVCINPSITQSCVVMPIGIQTGGSSTKAWSSLSVYGDFGAGNELNILPCGTNSSGSYLCGFSYPYYLYQNYSNANSYTVSFYPMSSSDQSVSYAPIGELDFGSYNSSTNNLIPIDYTDFTSMVFPSYTASIPSYTAQVAFDTGTPADIFDSTALSTEIPNFSVAADIDNCPYYGSLTSNIPFSYIAGNYTYSLT